MASDDEWEKPKSGQGGVEEHGIHVAKVRGTGACGSGVTVTATITIDREQAIGDFPKESTVQQQPSETIKQIEREKKKGQQPARNE